MGLGKEGDADRFTFAPAFAVLRAAHPAAKAVGSHLPLTPVPWPDSVALGTNSSFGADHVHEGEPVNAASSV